MNRGNFKSFSNCIKINLSLTMSQRILFFLLKLKIISGQQHQQMQGGHAENRLSGPNTPLTSTGSIEPRFPPKSGTTNPSGGVSSGGTQGAGSQFPIPSSPQTPTTVTTNPSSAPNPGKKNLRKKKCLYARGK